MAPARRLVIPFLVVMLSGVAAQAQLDQVLVDVTGDDRLDRLVVEQGRLVVAVNPGGRDFQTIEQELPAVTDLRSVLVADLDDDGLVDLYLVTGGENLLLLGDGSGRFRDGTADSGLADGGAGRGAEHLDVDGDGRLDLLLHNRGGDVLFWAEGGGVFTREDGSAEQIDPPASSAESGAAGVGGLIGVRDTVGATSGSSIDAGASAGSTPPDLGELVAWLRGGSPPPGIPEGQTAAEFLNTLTVQQFIDTLQFLYVNDGFGEVDTLDVADGSLRGADVSTSFGSVTHTGGNLGVGTASPVTRLDVSGSVGIFGTPVIDAQGRWVGDPTGLVGPTGPAGPGGGVPSGTIVLGETDQPPTGFSFTGSVLSNGGTNAWRADEAMPTPRLSFAAATVGETVYAIGGLLSGVVERLDVNEAWDAVSDSWSTKTPMPTARSDHAAAVYNNRVYVVGGFGATGFEDAFERYAPASNGWVTLPSLPTPRAGLAAANLDGKIYAVGGFGLTVLDTVEVYDPMTNSWSAVKPLPAPRYFMGAAVADGRLFVMGGLNAGNQAVNAVAAYDPVADDWSQVAPMPAIRSSLPAASVNGLIYVMGGANSSGVPTGNAAVYDPLDNEWTAIPGLSSPRLEHSAVTVLGKVVVLGGLDAMPTTLDLVEDFFPHRQVFLHRRN